MCCAVESYEAIALEIDPLKGAVATAALLALAGLLLLLLLLSTAAATQSTLTVYRVNSLIQRLIYEGTTIRSHCSK